MELKLASNVMWNEMKWNEMKWNEIKWTLASAFPNNPPHLTKAADGNNSCKWSSLLFLFHILIYS